MDYGTLKFNFYMLLYVCRTKDAEIKKGDAIMITTTLLSNVTGREEINPSWYTSERYAYCEDFTVIKKKSIFHLFKKNK